MFRNKCIFILIILLTFNIPLIYSATNEGYGEANDNLGQFTDSFENDDNVSVAYQVINNVTLECMELNYTTMTDVSNDTFQLREHKYYSGYNPSFAFGIDAGEYLLMTSTDPSLGIGWEFITIDDDFLNSTWIRWRWKWIGSYASAYPAYSFLYDGSYNRANNTEFPTGAFLLEKGVGQFWQYHEVGGKDTWFIRELEIDVDTGTEDSVTLLWYLIDGFSAQNFGLYIDWIEINEGSGGIGNIWRIDFNDAESVVMEVTGTTGDYGYVNNSGLPVQSGGYETDGYFITEDYLNYTTGNSLALLTNASIPVGTSMTVQFSNDNVTWVDNEGNVGSTPIGEGFYSIDLRDLNYTDDYKMVNFTGTSSLTPRLYQLREVTTNGTGGNGVTTYLEDYAGLLIVGLIIGLIIGIGASRS